RQAEQAFKVLVPTDVPRSDVPTEGARTRGRQGRPQPLPAFPYFRLQPLLVVDVRAGPEPLDGPVGLIPKGQAARLEPAALPVAAADAVFHVVGAAPRHGLQPGVPRRFAVVRVQRLQPPPAEQLALGHAGVLRPLGAEVVARAVRGRGPDELRERLGQAPPAVLARAQRLLGALMLGDVAVGLQHAPDPVGVADQLVPRGDDDLAAGLRPVAQLALPGPAGGQLRLDLGPRD